VGGLFNVRLKRAELLLTRAVSLAWSGYNLRSGTVGVMAQIDRFPGISQNEIARRFNIDKSAMNAIVNGLEKLGWAERRTDAADRRRHALHLTAAGMAELETIVARIELIEARMLARVPPATIALLRGLLDEVHASCLAAENETDPDP
jgi:DNA-binding MarR family transcriptional regulator